jgi:hypothetical protein
MKALLRLTVLAVAVGAATAVVVGQDASAVLAQAYTPVFENDWVKVVRAHYAPHVKLPAHPHTELAAAYVYLTDSGPVAFRHVGASYGAVTRPPVKAGTFRLYRAVKELHEVENMSPLASDFLRIEFKTEPLEAALLRGRFTRDATLTQNKVQFENAQVRITRLTKASGEGGVPATAGAYPRLLVDTTTGHVGWAKGGAPAHLESTGSAPPDILCFEFKTPPQRPPG